MEYSNRLAPGKAGARQASSAGISGGQERQVESNAIGGRRGFTAQVQMRGPLRLPNQTLLPNEAETHGIVGKEFLLENPPTLVGLSGIPAQLPESLLGPLAIPEKARSEEIGASLTTHWELTQDGTSAIPETRPAALESGLFGSGLVGAWPSPKAEIQVVHPENGRFDVVFVQSGQPSEVRDINPLKGSPIYTVYVTVGTQKPWALHYRPSSMAGDHLAKTVAGEPIAPPYPRFTVVPAEAACAETEAQLTLHGTIDAQGHLRQLESVLSKDGPSCTRLMPFLQKWLFRPASQSGVPVAIDVMLVVPARQ